MLRISNRPVEDVIRFLSGFGLEAGYIVPTETGLGKSIMDAHGGLRDYLRATGLHDFGRQAQGRDDKAYVPGWIVSLDARIPTRVSLYRPPTKNGDPRIWISRLPNHAGHGDLLALLAHRGELFVVNASTPGLLESGADPASPFGSLLAEMGADRDEPAADLLDKLRGIGARGFVPSLRAGPTGVGMTLETLLGIDANSSRSPDYRGIELKASRVLRGGRRQNNRITLFSKVPAWASSTVKTPVELLQRYGYDRKGRRQLYCSLNNAPNSLGLFLRTETEVLHASHGTVSAPSNVVQWDLDDLHSSLSEKHRDTFWVKAASRQGANGEEFHYQHVLHTRAPLVSNLKPLLELGHVEVDFALHLLSREPGQKPRARDHGYLFKIAPADLDLLFPPSTHHALSVSAS